MAVLTLGNDKSSRWLAFNHQVYHRILIVSLDICIWCHLSLTNSIVNCFDYHIFYSFDEIIHVRILFIAIKIIKYIMFMPNKWNWLNLSHTIKHRLTYHYMVDAIYRVISLVFYFLYSILKLKRYVIKEQKSLCSLRKWIWTVGKVKCNANAFLVWALSFPSLGSITILVRTLLVLFLFYSPILHMLDEWWLRSKS